MAGEASNTSVEYLDGLRQGAEQARSDAETSGYNSFGNPPGDVQQAITDLQYASPDTDRQIGFNAGVSTYYESCYDAYRSHDQAQIDAWNAFFNDQMAGLQQTIAAAQAGQQLTTPNAENQNPPQGQPGQPAQPAPDPSEDPGDDTDDEDTENPAGYDSSTTQHGTGKKITKTKVGDPPVGDGSGGDSSNVLGYQPVDETQPESGTNVGDGHGYDTSTNSGGGGKPPQKKKPGDPA